MLLKSQSRRKYSAIIFAERPVYGALPGHFQPFSSDRGSALFCLGLRQQTAWSSRSSIGLLAYLEPADLNFKEEIPLALNWADGSAIDTIRAR